MGILGIDIGGTNIRTGLVEDNKLVKVESIEVPKSGTKDEIINNIVTMIQKFSTKKINGIGIGVPSVVDIEKGIVYDVQNIPSWKEVHLKKILEKEFKVPVYINNDANCFAAGEKYFGSVKKYKNIIGLIIGTGLGAGIIVNNQLYSGNNCGAGEFGMIPFKNNNYEYYCCGQYFNNEFGKSGEEILASAEKGNRLALKIFDEYGSNLGEAIKMIMYALDPEVIILGGSVSKSYKFFEKVMWKSIKRFAYAKSAAKIKIEVSKVKHIAILGAAAIYLDVQEKNSIIN
ncbi:MAG: ROK family protein [Ignavibacteriaceae bacterium]